jgi:hypothetical protein
MTIGWRAAGLLAGRESDAAIRGLTLRSVADYGVNRSAPRRAGKGRAEAPEDAAEGRALQRESGVLHPRRR